VFVGVGGGHVLAEKCGSKNVLTSKPRHPPRGTKLKAKCTGFVKQQHHENVSGHLRALLGQESG